MPWSTIATRWPCFPRFRVAERLTLDRRLAVPRPIDGPKVTLGVLWVLSLFVAARWSGDLAVVVLTPVAALAGLQTAHRWTHHEPCDRWAVALTAAVLAASALFGVVALGAAVLAGTLALVLYALALPLPRGANRIRFAELSILCALPAGLAAGSLLALARDLPEAFVGLVLLVSAYEAGDFLIGSGAGNSFEGPVAGLVMLGLVAAGLYLVLPAPFTIADLPWFAGLAAVGAPLGQFAASALLPSGEDPAPALRRLDSYLLVAPLWLLLL